MPALTVFRADVKREADLGDTAENTDLDPVINDCCSELYDLLTTSFEDYNLTSSDLVVTAGNKAVALPATFYKARGVDDLASPTSPRALPRFEWADRNRVGKKCYAIAGANLEIRPADGAPGSYRLWFAPLYVDMVADADTFAAPNRWEQLAVLEAAARFRSIQQLDASALTARAERVRARIEQAAKHRDAGEPGKARDVRSARRSLRQLEAFDPEEF
jgi:hypothetical protein